MWELSWPCQENLERFAVERGGLGIVPRAQSKESPDRRQYSPFHSSQYLVSEVVSTSKTEKEPWNDIFLFDENNFRLSGNCVKVVFFLNFCSYCRLMHVAQVYPALLHRQLLTNQDTEDC